MKVLVFGAHPDDMEVVMGGTSARHSAMGDVVWMCVATVPSPGDTRRAEARRGAEILGAKLRILDIPPGELEYNRQTVRRVDQILNDFDPDVIYTQWDQDSHQDHNAISRSVISAARKN